MGNLKVNISFQDRLLAEIDAEAKRESRTRSELLREAARLYLHRQKQWERVFGRGRGRP
jgi:CopG family transcriptional regulator/antitoxin EndoAI